MITMSKNETIRKALGITYLVYDNFRSTCFENWCAIYASKEALPQRKLICNDYLYNWYCDQWVQLVEEVFYSDHKDYLESSVEAPDTFQDLFFEYPKTIERTWPQALLKMIRKDVKTKSHDTYTD